MGHVLDSGGRNPLLFTWQHGIEVSGVPSEAVAICYVVMQRSGGILLALPASAVEEEVLAQHAVSAGGEEALVGPYSVHPIPLEPGAVGGLPGEQCDVLLVDMSLPSVAHLLSNLPGGEGQPEAMVHFSDIDVTALPSLGAIVQVAKAWLPGETGEASFLLGRGRLPNPNVKGKGSNSSRWHCARRLQGRRQCQATPKETNGGFIGGSDGDGGGNIAYDCRATQSVGVLAGCIGEEPGKDPIGTPSNLCKQDSDARVRALRKPDSTAAAGGPVGRPTAQDQDPAPRDPHQWYEGLPGRRPKFCGWRSSIPQQSLCKSSLGTKPGPVRFGGSLSSCRRRSNDGACETDKCGWCEGGCRQGEASARVVNGHRPVFPQSVSIYEPAYVSYVSPAPEGCGSSRSFNAQLPGEVWRFRAEPRAGAYYVVLMCSTPLQRRTGAQSKTIWRSQV